MAKLNGPGTWGAPARKGKHRPARIVGTVHSGCPPQVKHPTTVVIDTDDGERWALKLTPEEAFELARTVAPEHLRRHPKYGP